jgi:2-oxoglutarate ferredoxin oxidoreductase subunit alpha
MDLNIRIAGAAGQGVETTGDLLAETFASQGLYIFASQTYMSRIRGGLNWYDVRVGDRALFSGREKADLLIALNEQALEWLKGDVADGGLSIYEGVERPGEIATAFEKVAKEVGGAAIMANIVAAGATFALLGYDLAGLEAQLAATFTRKGDAVVSANIACARKGAELAAPHAGRLRGPQPAGAPRAVCNSAEAVGLGGATAGVKFATGYPMTPSTGVLTYLAQVADRYGIVVEQAEDEIAAINMICGATYAGVPAMTTTSGGGFALMVEGLALSGMLELPVFIFLGQRPGPATGLPTRTAQQDLMFALNAGHGEFPRALFAPGTPQQHYDHTRHGLQLAHKYQTPVILLSDQFAADMRMNCTGLDDSYRPIDRHILSDPPEEYMRYAVTESGVSPRALPGSNAFVVLDSDEHDEDGHITEDLGVRVKMQDKRMRKLDGMVAEVIPPEWHGPPDAEHVLIAWGSSYGPCREAVDLLNAAGGPVAMLHFSQLWPVNGPAISDLLGPGRKVTSVECNQTGQFARLLRQVGALSDYDLMAKYNGLPFSAEEIARRLQ